ncbi:MAG: hypothetical protein ABIO45_12105 [Burkholderiaceae bacterium]
MDILAHGLWAGIGIGFASRRWNLSRRTIALTVTMAVLPDLVQLLPVSVWARSSQAGFAAIRAYSVALPGHEPALPPTVGLLTHHLHCVMHSAVVAAAVTAVSWLALRSLWIPLLGWWSHIVIDVFTHSADFYPSPVLYPFTQAGFDGLAWNTPWFVAVNYLALATAGAWLILGRRLR